MAIFQNNTVDTLHAKIGVGTGPHWHYIERGCMASKGPDDYTEATTEELTEKDLEVLARIWPGGFRAAANLLLMLDDDEIDDENPLLAMNLFDLVVSTFPEATDAEAR